MGWFILLFLYITAISILSGDMIRPIIVHYLRRGLAAVYLGLAFFGLGVVWIIYLPVYLFVILIKILSFYFMLLSSVFRPAATLFGYIRVSQPSRMERGCRSKGDSVQEKSPPIISSTSEPSIRMKNEASPCAGNWDRIETGFRIETRRAPKNCTSVLAAPLSKLTRIFRFRHAPLPPAWFP